MNKTVKYQPYEWVPNEFSLQGIDGKKYTLEQYRGSKGLVVMFICNHCPYVKAITSQLVIDMKALKENNILSIAIMSNDVVNYPDDSFENMKKFSERNNFNFPYVIDENQLVAKDFMALCTPDFFGFDSDLKLQYRGRLNSSGKNQISTKTKHDLVDAILLIRKMVLVQVNNFHLLGVKLNGKLIKKDIIEIPKLIIGHHY